MSKTQLKIGKCKYCGNTLIVDIEDDFICNTYGCFMIHQNPDEKRRKGEFTIIGEENVVHGIYHEHLKEGRSE